MGVGVNSARDNQASAEVQYHVVGAAPQITGSNGGDYSVLDDNRSGERLRASVTVDDLGVF
jgi:hypothetical protein